MRLELASYPVREVVLADATSYCEGVLRLDRAGLEARLAEQPGLGSVRLEVAYPGEHTRIVHVLDVLEPRVKVGQPGAAFPGVLAGPETAGNGRTNRLAGLAVVECGRFVDVEGLKMHRETIIDMSGPAAELVPFASTINLVAQFEPEPGIRHADYEQAIRKAGAQLAEEVARTTLGLEPEQVRSYALAEPRPDIPRVVWICLVQSEGLIEQSFVYGETTLGKLPMLLHPNEVLDGALIGGNFLFGCQRNRTYLYQNSALLEELYEADGRELSLAGVIVSPSMRFTLPEKERMAAFAAKTAAMLGATAAIITQEGGGHGMVDLMLHCNRCERLGIKTVLVNNEGNDAESTDTHFIYIVPEADAIVSTGKSGGKVSLPAMERVLGGNGLDIDDVVRDPSEAFVSGVRPLCCATSQLGANRLTVLEY